MDVDECDKPHGSGRGAPGRGRGRGRGGGSRGRKSRMSALGKKGKYAPPRGAGAQPSAAQGGLLLNTTAETAAADELVAPAEPTAAVHAADEMDADAAVQAEQTVRGQGRAVVESELKAQAMLADPPPPSAPTTPGMRRSRSPRPTQFEGTCAFGSQGAVHVR